MIIIEGMDNSGKTTLAKTLAAHFDWPLVHSPGYCPGMIDWTKKALLEDTIKIYDRFPLISEAVYGPILRNNNSFNSEKGKALISLFYDRKPLIIYCNPPVKIIERRMGEQMEGVKKHLGDLIISYNEHIRFLQQFNFYVVFYNYTDPSDDAVVKAVVTAYLDKLKTRGILDGNIL